MSNSENELDYRSIFVNYIILITLCLFVVIYIIINYDMIKTGNYYNGDITKSVLLTGIIILLLYLLATWDDDEKISSDQINHLDQVNELNQQDQQVNSLEIPKFSLADVNKLTNPVKPVQSMQTGSGSILPNVMVLPNVTNAPNVINLPNVTNVPNVTTLPNVTNVPNIVNIPMNNQVGLGESKYNINNLSIPNNSYSNPITNLSQVKRHIDKLENQNIFVSQKNSLRYGIKF